MAQPAFELDLVNRIVTRVDGELGEHFGTVLPALQLGDSVPQRLPACIVLVAGDDATESLAPTEGAYQRVTARVHVVHVIAAANTEANRGGPVVDPLAVLVGRTRGILNGWRQPDWPRRRDTMQLLRGSFARIEDGSALWRDEYNVSWRANRVPAGQSA